MKVLVIGANGFIGQQVMALLATQSDISVLAGVRRLRPGASNAECRVDISDSYLMAEALKGVDAVIDCVAGNATVIADGARNLCEAAALQPKPPLIVYLSSMAVYGQREGYVSEDCTGEQPLGWYAEAKNTAESHMRAYAASGGAVVILRPGIVYGPGSGAWVGRIANWLRSGRLGDIGALGDGFCNLVHVRDVAAAILASLRQPAARGRTFNLAMPAMPTWNRYFVGLSLAIGCVPVRRRGEAWLRRDSRFLAVPFKVLQMVLGKLRLPASWVPEPIPPALLRLWQQEIILDNTAATKVLGLTWTPLDDGIQDSVTWYLAQ